MKITRVYANKQFKNIKFNDNFNVILAEIFDKTKTEKDTHNLGKTALISVIDFLLLSKSNKKSFLNKGIFKGQIFYIEIKLNNGKFLVIKRGTDNPSKISFKLNDNEMKDFITDITWDFADLPFEESREKLNSFLDFNILPKWSYRKPLNYFLRTQQDYRDVFKLEKYKGKDIDWKPFVFNILGFDCELIEKKYSLEVEYNNNVNRLETLQRDANIDYREKDKIQGLLDLKIEKHKNIVESIDKFNFFSVDQKLNSELVEQVDARIQDLNTYRYSLKYDIEKIEKSLINSADNINLEEIKKIYSDVEIYFPESIIKNYEQLIDFNLSLTAERNKYLKDNYSELNKELLDVEDELLSLENKKEYIFSYLTEIDSYGKFKENQKHLSKIESEILFLIDEPTLKRSKILKTG